MHEEYRIILPYFYMSNKDTTEKVLGNILGGFRR